MEPKRTLPIESQADIPPDSWDSAPLTEYGCGKGENPLFSIVEGKGVEQDVSVRNDLALLSAEESLSQKILPHVRSLVKAKKSGDKKAMKHHERAINKLAGKKVIPRAFTEKEMENPEKLAKVISCISQVKEKGDGVNPFAVCRDQIMGAPDAEEKICEDCKIKINEEFVLVDANGEEYIAKIIRTKKHGLVLSLPEREG